MNLAPIALFVYNRPEHTRRVLDSLRCNLLAAESDLVIFSDAARKSVHQLNVGLVRTLIRDVAGFRSVRIVERERNLGLASSIEDGVGRLCDEQGAVIVVEDDLMVSPEFLSFMNRALQRYRDEPRVMQISGYMFPGTFESNADALFLPLISCWGWGTWKRAWAYYDPRATGFARLRANRALREEFNVGGAYDYYHMLEQQMQGEIDSWGIRWLLSVFLQQGLVLYPVQSLVQNIGVDGSGTHGAGVTCLQTTLAHNNDRQFSRLRLPDQIEVDNKAVDQVRATLRGVNPGILIRVVRKLIG
jgi:GT2 family glycosyltransferase